MTQDALKIPTSEQRLIYAGTQLEELVTPLWRQRRSSGALAAALGLDKLPDGAPLTLEHYGHSTCRKNMSLTDLTDFLGVEEMDRLRNDH